MKKEQILEILNGEWKSTTQIKNELKINWYIAAYNLMELILENKVEGYQTK